MNITLVNTPPGEKTPASPEGLADILGLNVGDSLRLTDADSLGLKVGDSLRLAEPDIDGLKVGDGLIVAEGLSVGL